MSRAVLTALVGLFLVGTSAVCASDSASTAGTDPGIPAVATLEVTGPLRRIERGALANAGVELGEYLGDNRYRALLPAEITAPELQDTFDFLRGVHPLAAADKLSPELREGELPAHARLPNGRLKLHVELFDSVKDAGELLAPHADAVRFIDETGAWEVELAPDQLEALAAEPAVERIEAAPDPRLL